MTLLHSLARVVGAILRFLLPVAVLGAAFLGARWLIQSKPQVERAERVVRPMPVEVLKVEPVERRRRVDAWGQVRARNQATLQSEVGGRVVEQHPELTLGGIIPAGEPILGIDRRDFEIAREEARAGVERARSELELELGRQLVSKREWELLGESVPTTELGRRLALREPQIADRRAALEIAEAALARAELDLERTVLRAPFDALVLEENVEVGELLRSGTSVARLASVAEYRVEVTLPIGDLEAVVAAMSASAPTEAAVWQTIDEDRRVLFEGRVERPLGALVPESRMARLLVLVEDPLGRRLRREHGFPLLLGAYVGVEIEGPILEEVFEIPRAALRANDTVWVMNAEDRLEIRTVEIADATKDSVLVAAGLAEGDRVVTSSLGVPVEGTLLAAARLEDDETSSASGEAR